MHLFLFMCVLLPALLKADTQCISQTGSCKYNTEACSGQYWSGKCRGSASRQCCIPGSQSGDSACVNTHKGYCQTNPRTCDGGSYRPRMCAGASNRQCCVPGSSPSLGSRRIAQICQSNRRNSLRTSDSYGRGNYGARRGSRPHKGVDVKCTGGDSVYAPFPAVYFRKSRPYKTTKCCNDGMLLRGTGDWAGYAVSLWYNEASISTGRRVNAGDRIGTHISLHCSSCYGSGMTDHTHFQLTYNGNIVDPTELMNK